jgi:hypothetical protein
MSFAKLASMLTKNALWFANFESFTNDDPFEAVLPRGNYLHREWTGIDDVPPGERERIIKTTYTRNPDTETAAIKVERAKEILDLRIRQAFAYRRSYFAHCWHASDYESAAMWRLYGELHNAVAIVSSRDRLTAGLAVSSEEILCGTVKYLDYDTASIDISNGLNPLLHKRKSFQFENEVRLVIWRSDLVSKTVPILLDGKVQNSRTGMEIHEIEAQPIIPGLQVDCDMNQLVKEIKVSPTSDRWFEEVVRDLCMLAGLRAPVSRSNLLTQPLK